MNSRKQIKQVGDTVGERLTTGKYNQQQMLLVTDYINFILPEKLAGSTGLEPAASGVTGRRSNQLNYDPGIRGKWWAIQGSNL